MGWEICGKAGGGIEGKKWDERGLGSQEKAQNSSLELVGSCCSFIPGIPSSLISLYPWNSLIPAVPSSLEFPHSFYPSILEFLIPPIPLSPFPDPCSPSIPAIPSPLLFPHPLIQGFPLSRDPGSICSLPAAFQPCSICSSLRLFPPALPNGFSRSLFPPWHAPAWHSPSPASRSPNPSGILPIPSSE